MISEPQLVHALNPPPCLQYYYNSQTQQYLCWDSEQQSYMPATDANAQAAAAGTSGSPPKEPKEKKDKPKSKTAQQVSPHSDTILTAINTHRRKGMARQG